MMLATITPETLSQLTRTQRDIYDLLKREKYSTIYTAFRTIAAKVGAHLQTVEIAFRRFRELGIIDVVRDYTKNTRHQIRLLWRIPAPKTPPSDQSHPESSSGKIQDQEPSMRTRSFPSPINRSPEGAKSVVLSSSEDTTPAPAESTTTMIQETDVDLSQGESNAMAASSPPRLATPEEIRETVELAKTIFADDPDAELKARAAAKTMGGLDRARKALLWARAKNARSFGYVVTLLKDWSQSGIVPAPPTDTTTTITAPKLTPANQRRADQRAAILAMFPAPVEGSEVTCGDR